MSSLPCTASYPSMLSLYTHRILLVLACLFFLHVLLPHPSFSIACYSWSLSMSTLVLRCNNSISPLHSQYSSVLPQDHCRRKMVPLTLQIFLVPSPHPSASTLSSSQSGALLNTPIFCFLYPPFHAYPFPLIPSCHLLFLHPFVLFNSGPVPGRAPAFRDTNGRCGWSAGLLLCQLNLSW